MKEEICRFCLKDQNDNDIEELQNIFSTFINNINKNVATMAMECAPFEIKQDDGYPELICNLCLENLKITFNFIKKSLKSLDYLKRLNQIKLEVNLDYDKNQSSTDFEPISDNNKLDNVNDNKKGFKYCSVCSKCFKSNKALKIHRKTHNDDNICKICGKFFLKHDNLIIHRRKHFEKQHICIHCEKTFSNSIELVKHNRRIHNIEKTRLKSDVKWVMCDNCCLKFENFELLNDHICNIQNRLNEDTNETLINSFIKDEILFEDSIVDLKSDSDFNEDIEKIKSEYSIFVYKCLICGLLLESTMDYNIHFEGHSKDKEFFCYVCNLSSNHSYNEEIVNFEKIQDYLEHFINTHENYFENEEIALEPPRTLYKKQISKLCKLCGKIFKAKYIFENHMRIHTDERPFNCKYCSKKFKQSGHLITHERIHRNERNYKCSDCSKSFITGSALRKHCVRQDHKCPEINLDSKGKIYKENKENTNEHQKITNPTSFKCEFCQVEFSSPLKCIQHQKETHPNDILGRFFCIICSKSLGSLNSLKNHCRIHSGERPFKCRDCNKTFKQNAHLTIHIRAHKNDKRYVCSWCSKSFITNSVLKKHVFKKHPKNYPVLLANPNQLQRRNSVLKKAEKNKNKEKEQFICEICGKSMKTKSSLAVHIRYHTGDKPFECTECDKKFFTASSLKDHVFKHSNKECPKKFICHICSESFKLKISLWRHKIKFHAGERKHKCTYCPKSFYENVALKKHLRVHTGERPEVCCICEKSFKEKHHLKTHMKIHYK